MNDDIAVNPAHVTKQAFFVQGMGQSQMIDAGLVHGGANEIVRTEVQASGMDVFLRVVTPGYLHASRSKSLLR